ncbi:MAG: peptidoglycan-binding protein [Hyphomicrobiales bacterium]
MAAKLDDLARRLNVLAAEDQKTAVGRVLETREAATRRDELALQSILDRLAAHERSTGDTITAIVERIESLGRDVAGLTERLAERNSAGTTVGYAALDTALRNVVDHIESSEGKTKDVLQSIQDKISELTSRPGASTSDPAIGSALASLEQRVSSLASQMTAGDYLTRAEARTLIEKAEGAAAAAAQREMEQFDSRVDGLMKQAQAACDSEVKLLRATVEALARHVEDSGSASPSASLAALEQRIAEFDNRLSGQPQHRVEDALADLDRRISAIDEALTTQLAASRLSAAPAPSADLRAFEARIAELTQRIEATEGQITHFDTIESAVTQLYQALEENRAHLEQMGHPVAAGGPSPEVAALEQGLAAVQAAAADSDRRTQETLQAVHETLEQIIMRLADLDAQPQPVAEPADAAGEAWNEPAQPAYEAPEAPSLETAAPMYAPPQPVAAAPAQAMEDPFAGTGPTPDASSAQPQPSFGIKPRPAVKWTDAVRAHLAAQAQAQSQDRLEPTLAEAERAPNAYDAAGFDPIPGDTSDDLKVRTDFIAAARRAAQEAAERAQLSVDPEDIVRAATEEPVGRLRKILNMLKRASKSDDDKGSGSGGSADAGGEKSSRKRLIVAGLLLLAVVSAYAYKSRSLHHDAPAALPTSESSKLSALPKSAPAAPVAQLGASTPSVPATATTVQDLAPSLTTSSVGLVAAPDQPAVGDVIAGMPGPEAGPEALRRAAASGNPIAQFVVATNYLEDRSRAPDYANAAQWLAKAAQQGLAPAEYRLGTLYERGRGVPLDLASAGQFYERAARQGNVRAMHNLAVLYTGTNGQADFKAAAYWFGQAASFGLKDSQFNLAILYERGMGVQQDLKLAYFWYTLSARQGDPDAQARVEALRPSLKDDAEKVEQQVAQWQPKTPDKAANVVAVTDPEWRADFPSLPPLGQQKSEAAAPAPVAPPPARPDAAQTTPAPTLTKDQMVLNAQKLLSKLGFDPGTADGRMGARTANAIRLFQLQHGLNVDGSVSPELLATLERQSG